MFLILIKGLCRPGATKQNFKNFVESITGKEKPKLLRKFEGTWSGERVCSMEYALSSGGSYRETRRKAEEIIANALSSAENRTATKKFRLSIEIVEVLQDRIVENAEVWIIADYEKIKKSGYEKEPVSIPQAVEVEG